MKKDIRLIALDLDSTLLNSSKQVTAHTNEVLEECARRGIIVIPATGRAATGFPDVLRAVPSFRYALTSNGAQVYDYERQEGIYKDLLSTEHALEILEFSRSYDIMCDAYIDGNGYSEKDKMDQVERYFVTEPNMIAYMRSTRLVVDDLGSFIREKQAQVEKMVFFFADISEREKVEEKLASFDYARVNRVLRNNLELNSITANKGDSLLRFGAQMGFTRDQIMACGDGANDLDMIRAAGFGVAMGNAVQSIKDAADYITLTNDEDGVAYAIEQFVL